MSSADNQKGVISAINAYMLTALLSIFITGVVLILLVFLFGMQIFGMNPNTNLYIIIFQLCTIIVLILGLVFISVGIIQSIRLMKSMKKITDSILSGDFFEIITKTSKSSGIGGGLNIIRPPMTSRETTPPNQKPPSSKLQPISKSKQEIKQKTQERMKKETPKAKSTSEKEETESDEELDISLEEALQKIVDRYNEPKVSSAFSLVSGMIL